MRYRGLFACLLPALVLAVAAKGSASSPLVAGFDRFAGEDPTRAGRLLLTELGCTACHQPAHQSLNPKRGPVLRGAGEQLNMEWVSRFLSDPQQAKPATTMPNMFVGWDPEQRRAAIEALVAFLMTQQGAYPELNSTASNPIARQFWLKGDVSRGQAQYHRVGCVACHEPDAAYNTAARPQSGLDAETLAELGIVSSAQPVRSIPHPALGQKYSHKSLTHFLLDPLTTRPAGRMPSLKLKPDEAADIAAYLLADQEDPIRAASQIGDASLIAVGKRLFQEIGCANCHDADQVTTMAEAPNLADLDSGVDSSCIGASRRGLPYYALEPQQREALEQALADPVVDKPAQHRMLQLNCYACHQRDERGGVGSERRHYFETVGQVDLGDEGRLPPPLSRVGRKLTPHWMRQVLAGSGDVRSYLTIRMPIFGASADQLATDLVAADSGERISDPFAGIESTPQAGRQLFDLGCVQCHPLGGEKLPGVVGVDIAAIGRRVQPSWFRDFLLDPAAMKPRTRMPSFFRNGKSSAPDVIGGDVERQVASLWSYLEAFDKYPLPAKIQQDRAHDFELVPKDRPLILRTFMEHAGPHAIAVGFPQRVHLAFDAERVGVAQFWRGRFLDAHGTWFDRFAPPARPLGDDAIELAVASDPPDRVFRGYRLDQSGVPTFLYRAGDVDIEDRVRPTTDNGFARTLILSASAHADSAQRVQIPVISGTRLQRRQNTVSNDNGLTVTIVSGADDQPVIQTVNGLTTCAIPAMVVGSVSIELEYQW